ncbi:hypothetical protein ACROYT_G014143 [Oculina patagonica]
MSKSTSLKICLCTSISLTRTEKPFPGRPVQCLFLIYCKWAWFNVEQQTIREPGLGENLTVLINDIAITMKMLDYALYIGKIHKKCEGAKYTYSYKCDIKAIVNSLAANKSFKSRLVRDMNRVVDLLRDSDCKLIRPSTTISQRLTKHTAGLWRKESS